MHLHPCHESTSCLKLHLVGQLADCVNHLKVGKILHLQTYVSASRPTLDPQFGYITALYCKTGIQIIFQIATLKKVVYYKQKLG